MMLLVFIFLSLLKFTEGRKCAGLGGEVCCFGFTFNATTGECDKCPIGYIGSDCSLKCDFPSYGEDCQNICKCKKNSCHFIFGCLVEKASETAIASTLTTPNVPNQYYSVTSKTSTEFHTVTDSTVYSSTALTKDGLFKNNFVLYIITSLVGVFVFSFAIFVAVYFYHKCFQRRFANAPQEIQNYLNPEYKSLNFKPADPEQEIIIHTGHRERLNTDPTYLSPVFQQSTSYEEVEGCDSPETKEGNEVHEFCQPINGHERDLNFSPECSNKHVYVEIIDDIEVATCENEISEEYVENDKEFNIERRSPEGKEFDYVNEL